MSTTDTFAGRKRRPVGKRRRGGRALSELHYQLRTEGNSPTQQGVSIFLGVLIGSLPIWGVHLPVCIFAAWLFGASRVKTYLAAHINNPLTAPILLVLQVGVGHWLRFGEWLALDWGKMKSVGWFDLGWDLAIGSVAVGFALAIPLGIFAFVIGVRWKTAPTFRMILREAATYPYVDTGIFNWEFARGKIKWDPVFFGFLRAGLLPTEGRLTDLGCGRGLLLSLARAAIVHRDDWPADWGPAPKRLDLHGVDIDEDHVDAAAEALGDAAFLEHDDLLDYTPPESDCIVLFDVLHYVDRAAQERLLQHCAEVLRPGGSVVIREADAAGGFRFFLTRAAERVCAWGRRDWGRKFWFRTQDEWAQALREVGLEVENRSMSEGTPYANVLIVGRSGPRAVDPAESA